MDGQSQPLDAEHHLFWPFQANSRSINAAAYTAGPSRNQRDHVMAHGSLQSLKMLPGCGEPQNHHTPLGLPKAGITL